MNLRADEISVRLQRPREQPALPLMIVEQKQDCRPRIDRHALRRAAERQAAAFAPLWPKGLDQHAHRRAQLLRGVHFRTGTT